MIELNSNIFSKIRWPSKPCFSINYGDVQNGYSLLIFSPNNAYFWSNPYKTFKSNFSMKNYIQRRIQNSVKHLRWFKPPVFDIFGFLIFARFNALWKLSSGTIPYKHNRLTLISLSSFQHFRQIADINIT